MLTNAGLGAPSAPGAKEPTPTISPTSGVRARELSVDSDRERSSSRPSRTSRVPVRVDEVGDVAVAIAAKHGRSGRAVAAAAPKLRPRRELEDLPIGHRDAFVLSLIDGKTSVEVIVDLAAMPACEVLAILDRMAALGVVSLP